MQRDWKRYAVVAVLAANVAALAFLDESALSMYVLLALTAIVTVGVSLLMGQAGQVSLGQGAFYAIGAYAAGVLTTRGYPTLLGLFVAPFAAAAITASLSAWLKLPPRLMLATSPAVKVPPA